MTDSKKKLDSFNESRDYSLNYDALEKLKGKEGVAKLLNTSLTKGLNEEEVENRRNDFGRNDFPAKEMDSWFDMFLESFEDETLKVLIGAAIFSLVIGLWSDFKKDYNADKHSFIHINDFTSFVACFTWISSGWIEGGAILLAVMVVAVVTASNNYNKEAQFRQLNAKKEDIKVLVKRNNTFKNIQIAEVVVGDLVKLTTGDKIPADGIFVEGTDVKTSEASLTGETNDQPKSVMVDPFLLSGTTMSSGDCSMLVTAVGENSRWGKIRAGLEVEERPTPLQQKLEVVADQIGNIGKIAAVATFIAVIGMNYFDESTRPVAEGTNTPLSLFDCVLKAFILAVTIVVVAVPEGLPLAVTLSLAYSTKKMMNDNNLIRKLDACETMGNATNICTDKTGTLTMNRMTVVEGWFGDVLKVYSAEVASSKKTSHIDLVKSDLNAAVSDHIIHNCAYNSTTVLLEDEMTKEIVVQGNKTEGALLMFIKNCFNSDKTDYPRKESDTLFTFTSARKRMSALIYSGKNSEATLYCKGASEVIVDLCSKYINDKGNEVKLTETKRNELKKIINTMAQKQLRTICLAHRVVTINNKAVTAEALECELTLDAIVGIKDPLRPDVIQAIKECQRAGIFVRMVTGDNVETAKAIAAECGIFTEGGSVMEGPEFRKLTPAQLDAKLPTLQVLARSSPDDKLLLVSRLNGRLPKNEKEWKEKHPDGNWKTQRDLMLPGYEDEWKASRAKGANLYEEVVGVTGDGTNDGPALVAADVGLSMGIAGTEVAKDASSIVILDDSFASIVKAVMWGRSVFDNIRKFLQFQLTVNVVALTITFVAAIKGKEPPLSAVMMLWVNMIMDTMGALALGTEPPSEELLHRLPYKRSASLVSNKMIRNIFFQYVYQMALLYYLLLGGGMAHFVTDHANMDEDLKITIIFNSFVICQVFNEINARSIDDNMNVFYGIFRNPLFLSIIVFTLVAQYYIVTYGGVQFVGTVPLDESQWIKCILLGSLSLTVGGIMRLFPVRDSKDDIAAISQLMIDSKKIAERTTKKDAAKVFSFSFIIWLSTVAIIPVLTLEYFPLLKEQLIQRLQQQ